VDTVSTAMRSSVMARVRSKHNKSTEWRLRAYLIRAGIRGWILHPSDICGKPDFVYRAQQVAIFVDGCFWHGCPACGRCPSSHTAYWQEKIARNRKRDSTVTTCLRRDGWKVIRIWEHQLIDVGPVVSRIKKTLESAN
jgi:DNA mismatch endonuclease (patch repair protein)